FPPYLGAAVKNAKLDYYCNNSVHYTLRGVHVKLDILWNWEAPEGTGDAYEAAFRGTKSRVEIRQGKAERYVPELYVVPESGDVLAALSAKVDALQSKFPGLSIHQNGSEARLGEGQHAGEVLHYDQGRGGGTLSWHNEQLGLMSAIINVWRYNRDWKL